MAMKRVHELKQELMEASVVCESNVVSLGDDEVKEITISHQIGTQESIGHPSYMGHSMWPNVMPHPMRPTMAQGGSIFPFFPTLCPTGTSLNQLMPSFPNSQSLLNGQVWMGQSTIAETQGQYWGGPQPSMLESQWQGCGAQQSYTQMMHAPDNVEE
ncbi:hypothetical protein RHMOL_Rhmol03G0114700 [Rhododendron molle]|uniref:Uncharacterized protein n=1 Tax=Rhododendron molle TaxID=49168 RepID=A0ACC0PDH7_RHOML|nr:hypothetical protein RHMOL_Rhmol03G0114700 [Rhododendron molle]